MAQQLQAPLPKGQLHRLRGNHTNDFESIEKTKIFERTRFGNGYNYNAPKIYDFSYNLLFQSKKVNKDLKNYNDNDGDNYIVLTRLPGLE